ncbi:hypothetical protein ABT169_17645 [Streptomyces sp. NPDC001616]|uniref:hypothetical protein n=1 Tax=Streptomyces sp. NPDC001616 TaxID=3156648 RepID=UPI00332BDB36
MSALTKTLISAVSATVLAAGFGLATAVPAHAVSCPSSATPEITGAEAHWVLSCSGGALKVYGWVDDTLLDGRSAIVEVYPGGGHHWRLVEARGAGVRTNFDFRFPGTTSANVQLRLSR